jgi:hypothetical protein
MDILLFYTVALQALQNVSIFISIEILQTV